MFIKRNGNKINITPESPYADHIKKYPYCFRAFLESKEAQELIAFEDEELFPEGLIGSYQNWFMEKAGYDKMEKDYRKLLECAKFYAQADYEVKISREGYLESIMWNKESPEILEDAGERARQVLSEIENGK
jgi:hypothetical protein